MCVLYSTNCPKCKILERKLLEKDIDYQKETDVDKMLALGISTAPMLEVDDKGMMDFSDALKWLSVKTKEPANECMECGI